MIGVVNVQIRKKFHDRNFFLEYVRELGNSDGETDLPSSELSFDFVPIAENVWPTDVKGDDSINLWSDDETTI